MREAGGRWITVEAAAYDYTDDPFIRGILITCKPIDDRSDVGRAIELLSTGAPIDEVLPVIARLGDSTLTNTRCLISSRSNDDVHIDVACFGT